MVFGAFLAVYNIVLAKKYMDIFLEPREGALGWAGWVPFAVWEVVKISHTMELKDVEILTGQNPGVNLVLNVVAMGAAGVLSYAVEIWKRLLFPAVYVTLLTASEALVVFGLGYLSGWGISIQVYFLASNIVVSLLVIGIWRHAVRLEIQRGTVKRGNHLLIIPFICTSLYYILFETAASAGIHDREILKGLIVAALLVIAALLSVCSLYARLAKEYQVLKSSQVYLKQMRAYKMYFSEREKADNELIKMRHDLKQQLILIRNQLVHKEYEEMEKLIDGMIGRTFSLARTKYDTGNLALEAQLNELEVVAEEKGIAAYVDIDVPGKMRFNDEDMSILLGNAIDNAVEALERAEGVNKRIWVSVRYCKGMLQIRFRNDCADSGESRKRISSKLGRHHGIGLLSIARIVRKYKGSMRAGAKEGLFCLDITLYEREDS